MSFNTLTVDSEDLKAHSVDLLGSWDNFTKTYPMKLDTRRGGDQWTCCYAFDDMVANGDEFVPDGKRNGGLKMGSTYWYYYSIDGGITETYNEAEPHSTHCPQLPGQCVNVLEVPIEGPSESRRHSTCSTIVSATLDPEDRYINPRPAPSPKPNRPRLATTASDDSAASSRRPTLHKWLQYPATAAGNSSHHRRLGGSAGRATRTATTAAKSTVKSTVAFLKSLDAAIPVEATRGRSRTWPTNRRPETQSPQPQTSLTTSQEESTSSTVDVPRPCNLDPQQRESQGQGSSQARKSIHQRHVSDSPVPSPRIVTDALHIRSGSADQLWDRSSYSSIPSFIGAQNVAMAQASTQDQSHWHMKEPVSDSSSIASPIYDKELPPLPAYLIPEPLHIRTDFGMEMVEEPSLIRNEQDCAYTLKSRFSEWTVNQSRFSEWTAYSFESEEEDELDADEGECEMSPTLSSVHGGSLVAFTPRRVTEHQPDQDTLQQLRAAIDSLAPPLQDTVQPLCTPPYLAATHEVVPGTDGFARLGDAETTSTGLPKLIEALGPANGPLVAGESTLVAELLSEFDYLGEMLS